jgi:glycosidase/carbohydrate-binding DOMON domain-containing protein
MSSNRGGFSRRTVLGGLAGLGMFSAAGMHSGPGAAEALAETGYTPTIERSRHPGHPRFVAVGERLTNPIFIGEVDGHDQDVYGDRDNLAPGGSPDIDPENYDTGDFEWSIADRPDGSDAELTFASPSDENDEDRYDEGRDNIAEFEADAPGTYVLELEDDTGDVHELTIHAFPEGDGPRPRVELEGAYDGDGGQFGLDANPQLAPDSSASEGDLEVVFLADDRDALSTDAIDVDGHEATVDAEALGDESARVHAAAWDGAAYSVLDTVELDPDGSVALPNRPPEWSNDAVVYQIFTRSWAGERYATDFDVMIRGDDDLGAQGLDYLADLGIDAVWLTPVVPSVSSQMQNDGFYVGGGPHGYDTIDYFDVAPDLAPDDKTPLEAYREFVDACHERDITVIFDTVVNHAGRFNDQFQETIADSEGDVEDTWWDFPRVTEWDEDSPYFDWFDRVEAERIADGHEVFDDGTVLEPSPRPTGFWDLMVMPNWNYENLAVREYMLAFAEFWVDEIGVDGLRCDIAWGVPHSFWKEFREVVHAHDSEVLLFDESIPNDADFAENEFDMHYDKVAFTDTALAIAQGHGDAGGFLSAIEGRRSDGFPEKSLFYNCIENHDEERVLDAALDAYDDEEYASKIQRATWAATVTLPGVPAIYYGQEREISKYGTERHRGEDDPRDDGDVQPDDMRRAFMNWGEEFDADHLEFYRELIGVYHDHTVLQNEADVREDWYDAGGAHVLVFGRDASHLDDVDGPERALVAINYEAEPVEIDLRETVNGTDLVSGDGIETDGDEGTMTVEVDTVAVLETEDFEAVSELVARWDDVAGDDYGPGWYEYPTSDEFAEGSFDLRGLEVRDAGDTYEFALDVETLENVWDLEHGFSTQFPQIYVHDPGAPDEQGSTEPNRDGVGVTFEQPYHHELMGTGEWGGWLDPADSGDGMAVDVSADGDEIVFEVPAGAFDAAFEDLEFAPLLLGFDGEGPGGARPVTADGGEWVFEDTAFGAEADDTRHNVLDAITPDGVTNADALGYDADERATVPFVSAIEGARNVVFRGDQIASFDVGEGTDRGPGNYEYPTVDEVPEGALDLERVDLYEDDDTYTFAFRMVEPFHNPWGGDDGFSLQHVQVYVRDPNGEDGTAETLDGVNAGFADDYHYWLAANFEWTSFETADGEELSGLEVEGYEPENTIVLRVPADVVEGDLDDLAFAPLVFGHDGYGPGGIRQVEEHATEWEFGGAENENAPNVIDMATPEEVSREEALAYSTDSLAEIPYVGLDAEVSVREAIVDEEPPTPDDLQTAREYRHSGEPAPGTGGGTVDQETFRDIARDVRGHGAGDDHPGGGRSDEAPERSDESPGQGN